MDTMRDLQSSMRLGKPKDIYYYTTDTMFKQTIPTIVDNRFSQALNNLRSGSSTFIISVDQGISDIILGVELPEQGEGFSVGGNGCDYTNLAVPRGWLYSLIDRLSIRYSGSPQFFFTGAQMLIENLREMPNPTTAAQLFQLGGAMMNSVSAFSGDNLYAYAYLNVPHNSPNGSLMKPNPFPSELLSQPIVLTLQLNPIQSIFSSGVAGGSLAGAPIQLENGYFQVKQVHAKDRGELFFASSDRGKAYSFPIKAFYQNEVTVSLPKGGGGNTGKYDVLLTGFRNGQVRSIIFWITEDDDVNPPDQTVPFAKNFTNYYLPHDVRLLYNGQVFYDTDGPASQMFDIISKKTPSQLSCTVLTPPVTAGNPVTVVDTPVNWVEIPFSQVYEQLSGTSMYVAGKEIMNSNINISVRMVDTTKAYTLHAIYSYNCTMMISAGSVDYIFA